MEEKSYDQRRERLLELVRSKRLKALQQELEEMNQFDIAEFITELGEEDSVKMATVFRLLSKERGAEVFAELDAPEQQEIIGEFLDTDARGIGKIRKTKYDYPYQDIHHDRTFPVFSVDSVFHHMMHFPSSFCNDSL